MINESLDARAHVLVGKSVDVPDYNPTGRERLLESFVPLPLRLAAAGLAAPGETPMALLWLDIVHSTGLTVRFVESGPVGIEGLASVLGRHFDALLETIVAHGGEALTFAGDGLLAGWRCTETDAREAALRAAACGQAILDQPGIVLDEGGRLELHAALAFGMVHTTEIGTGTSCLCMTVGDGLADLQSLTSARSVGRLLVSERLRGLLGDAASFSPVEGGGVTLASIAAVPAPRSLAFAPVPEAARDALAIHVPLPVASRLDQQSLDWAAELRWVTAVFATLPGLDHASPDILDRLHLAMSAIDPVIARHDGVLHKLWGDETGTSLLILFGIPPIAHADDAIRGVACAIDLHDALRAIDQPSSFGVGTGKVFTGVVGNDTLRAWVSYGEPINLAARLKSLGQAAIQCDEATVRGARDVFEFNPLRPAWIRGLTALTPSWTPAGPQRPVRAPTVIGRLEQRERLRETLDAAMKGTGTALLIEGESGMGKSHLLAGFREEAAEAGAAVLVSQASRIEIIVPYRGWQGVLLDLLDLDHTAPVEEQRAAVIAALGPELAPRAALLNAILPLDLPESPETRSLQQAQRTPMRVALITEMLRRAAARQPLLVTIDDVHWLDQESWVLAEAVAGRVSRLCLVLAMQPMDDEHWPQALAAAGADRLRLPELRTEDEVALALWRLGAERLSPALAAFVHERAQGHPFFCLELTHALHEGGLVEVVDGMCDFVAGPGETDVTLPSTVQGIVMRRLDRLDPESQLTLKVGSVAGLRFPTEMVSDVHPTARNSRAAIDAHLAAHHRSGLLVPDLDGELEGYEFRHGIIRDVTYELMLIAQRRQLHREIGSWYERRAGEDRSRIYALLAYHAEAAGEIGQAAELLRLETHRVFGLGLGRQSVGIGLRAARLLGADIGESVDAVAQAIGAEMEAIAVLMGDRQPQDLARLPQLADPKAAQLIGLLLDLAPFAHQSHQLELFALLGCICLRLTLEHGNGDFAPDVYSMYSVVYGGLTGDRQTAFAWSRLGLDLQNGAEEASFARCAFIHAWFNNHWVRPIGEGIEVVHRGIDAGFDHDEIIYGCFNMSATVVLRAAAGQPLGAVMEACRVYLPRNAKRVMNANYHLVFELQYAKALIGLTAGPLDLGDDEFDADADVAAVLKTDLSNQIGYYMVTEAKLHVMAGSWDGALSWAARGQEMLPFYGGQAAEFELAQYRAIAAFASLLFGGAAVPDAAVRLEIAQSCAAQLRAWAVHNPGTFFHKSALVDGLAEALAGDATGAATKLGEAGKVALASGFLQDAGLAHEMKARLARLQGKAGVAAEAAHEACAAFRAWGAEGKAVRLEDEFAAI